MKRRLVKNSTFLSSALILLSFFCISHAGAEESALGARDMTVEAGASLVKVKQRPRVVTVSAPGELSQPDTEYVLASDIAADGTAFRIKASNVTLNLNGHEVVYSNADSATAFGVQVEGYQRKDISIVNGRITQGKGKCAGNQHGIGCNPVYSYETAGVEVGGLEIVYSAPDTTGILLHWGKDARIHHNTIEDLGSVVTNRHQGVSAVQAGGRFTGVVVEHNLVKRARHRGISATGEVFSNEVHIDSMATNSTGITGRAGSVHHNKVFGKGVHPIGIWPGDDIKVFSNYVEVENTRHGGEYGDTGAAGLRMTWGNNRVEVMHNTFIVHAGLRQNGVRSWGRALWVGLPGKEQEAYFHDNLIIANNSDGESKAAGIAVVCLNESPKLVFSRNRVVSNWANVLLADTYGHAGGFARFVENEFVRQDSHGSYKTIRSQYSPNQSTGVFISNKFLNGASLDSIDLELPGSGKKEVAFGWLIDVAVTENGKPLNNADIEILDRTGAVVFKGSTGPEGTVSAEVIEYLMTNQARPWGRNSKTPHKVIVSKGAKSASRAVSVNGNKSMEFKL